MRVIIAGSRSIGSLEEVVRAIKQSGFNITEVVSGGAQGVDQLGKFWAYNAGIPTKQFNPHWTENGKAAGPIRNREMAQYADALIAVWDGKSRGTMNMIEEMQKLNKPMFVVL
jgi:SLOG family YspA-like protein